MKFNLLLSLASLVVTVQSSFSYSSGWSPGQTETARRPESTRLEAAVPEKPRFTWSSLLLSGPLGSLLANSGINITQKLEEAQRKVADLPWDDRIPMIRDDNFEEVILNEQFATREEEESRLWFIMVTVTSTQRTGISAILDEQFNDAFNTSCIELDLPHVRWGRIDYFNVTRLTTKWAVWRAPMLIVAKDRGKTLRFFYPQQIGARASQLRTFLLEDVWKNRKPWAGPWAPGGSREDLLNKFAVFQEKLYIYMTMIPRWMYFIISWGLGSAIIRLCHRKPNRTSGGQVQTAQPTSSIPAAKKDQTSGQEPSLLREETRKPDSRRRKSVKK